MTQMDAFKFQEKQKRIQKQAVLRKTSLHLVIIMPRHHRRLLPYLHHPALHHLAKKYKPTKLMIATMMMVW